MDLITDLANWLSDMPNQTLPIYLMQFPLKDSAGNPIINCVAIFPAGGPQPKYYSDSGAKGIGALDYPNLQVQVRYIDPWNAFAICESIRAWLDMNPPTGYLIVRTTRAQPDDLTSDADLSMVGGPCYRFSCNFEFTKVRT
jgi:hypothetical protein